MKTILIDQTKKASFQIFLILFAMSLVSCDPEQRTDFKIKNSSSERLFISTFESDFDGSLLETQSEVAAGYELYVLHFWDFPSCGGNKATHFLALSRFDSLIVTNESGVRTGVNFFDASLWSYEPRNKDCSADLEIELLDGDFE